MYTRPENTVIDSAYRSRASDDQTDRAPEQPEPLRSGAMNVARIQPLTISLTVFGLVLSCGHLLVRWAGHAMKTLTLRSPLNRDLR